MHLDIHLHQGFPHVLDVRRRQLHKPLALAQIRAQRRDLALGKEAGAQETELMQALQPLGIADVGLATRHVLGVARVDQNHLEAWLLQDLEHRNPVDPGRLHGDRLDPALL